MYLLYDWINRLILLTRASCIAKLCHFLFIDQGREHHFDDIPYLLENNPASV